MATDVVSQVRSSMPGPEAAALVRDIVRAQVQEQAGRWARINSTVDALKRRGEINHFSEGISELVLRERPDL